MEYILFLTYCCNLSCEYCFAKDLVHNNKGNATISQEHINRICNYIKSDIILNHRKNNSIVFFGGEPSLVPDVIIDIINKTYDLNLKYSIYTNGLLIDKLPDILLEKMQTILVAIDGYKESHERFKPQGSYEQIINNVQSIRNRTNAQIIGRITLEEESNIFYSVKNILKYFDFVHWQIVNKNDFVNPEKFINDYKNNVNDLFAYWKESLKNGVVLNIIPFNRIVLSLLTNEKSASFRCGCGSSIQAIDIDGNIYSCDEYINQTSQSIGNINSNAHNLIKYKSHIELFADCGKCDISNICLGRCRKSLETQPPKLIKIYCALTHILVDMILQSLDEIRDIITSQKIDWKRLHTEIYNTEIIP